MNENTFLVDDKLAGRRLDRILRRKRPDLPYDRIQRLFREHHVHLNGIPASASFRPRIGDRIEIQSANRLPRVPANPEVAFEVVHEDEQIIVVSKPAGLAVHPGKKQNTRTLQSGLLHRYGDALRTLGEACSFGLVHRLDLGTSGLLLVARNRDAHHDLTEQFRRREVAKNYRALVGGTPPRLEWSIQIPMKRQTIRGQTRMAIAPRGGLSATTDYRVIESFDRLNYLDVYPRTGRTHQIRVHLAAVGIPIVGDTVYGSSSLNAEARSRWGINRLFLHAYRLRFTHPATQQSFTIEAPLPAELHEALQHIRSARTG